jgi:hypothetical protein
MHGLSIFDRRTVLLLLIGSLSNDTLYYSPLLLPGGSAFLAPPAVLYNSHLSYFTSVARPQQQHCRSLFQHHHVVQQQQKRRRLAVATAGGPTDDQEASGATAPATTDQEIEAIVWGWSREASDDIRRATLKAKLTDLLEAGALDRAKEIDACIVALGSRLQKQQAAATAVASSDAAGNTEDDGASNKEQQIWALVDMMVQTKTILNRFKQNEFRKRQELGTSPEEQDPSSTPTTAQS